MADSVRLKLTICQPLMNWFCRYPNDCLPIAYIFSHNRISANPRTGANCNRP